MNYLTLLRLILGTFPVQFRKGAWDYLQQEYERIQ